MRRKTRNPIVVLAGPTGAGKSTLAKQIAKKYHAEIINVDAFQIYRGMEIGTAQPSLKEQQEIPHHLYGFQDPREGMSAASYAALADRTIDQVISRGKRALVVGGSGFYLRTLLWGLFQAPPPDPELRASLAEQARQENGKEKLHNLLGKIDPESAKRLPVADVYRVNRALEVFYQTGKTLSDHHRAQSHTPYYQARILVLSPEKEELRKRQEARVKIMFASGWEEEVRKLLASNISIDAPGFRALGYREIASLVQGNSKREKIIPSILREHKRYAKRQRTWMRKEEGANFFSLHELSALDNAAAEGWRITD